MSNEEDQGAPTPLDVDPERRCAAFRAMREEGPVVAMPGVPGVLAAVSYGAVDEGLRSVHHFGGSAGQDGVPEVDKMIAGLLEPRHGQVRKIINSVVAIHRSQQIEPYLQDLAVRLVDDLVREARMAGARGVDLMAHLAEPIPPAAMARLFGFPEDDAVHYYGWIRQSGQRFQEAARTGAAISMASSSPDLSRYVDERIQERLAVPREEWPNDALARFLTTDIDGERLEPRAIKAQIMFMIAAGAETTRNTIGNLFHRLAKDPAAYEALRADPSLADAAIEETLRIDAPAQFMVRTCIEPIELDGERIEAGQQVFMCIGSANHDDAVHEAPDEFRLDRASKNHLAFGSGPHVCPGAPLARQEIRAAITAFTARVERFHLAGPGSYDAMPTAMLHGPQTLPIVIEAEVAD